MVWTHKFVHAKVCRRSELELFSVLQRDSPSINRLGDKKEIVILRKMHHWRHLEYSLISEESVNTCQAQSCKANLKVDNFHSQDCPSLLPTPNVFKS